MSPQYTPDLTAVQASLDQFEKGQYEFTIGEPKSFQRENNQGATSVGVRYPIMLSEAVNGHKKGARQIYSCYIHSEGGMTFSKRFIMAALGYKNNAEDEKKFDEVYRGANWSVDPETGAVGDVWRLPTGRRIIADMEMGLYNNAPSQQFNGFLPVAA